jgi:hypothetical protein
MREKICIMRSFIICTLLQPNDISAIKSRRMRWVGYVACMEEGSNGYEIWEAKSEEKRLLWRPRRTWEDNIKVKPWTA